MTTHKINCDVCNRLVSKSRLSKHRMTLNCKCTANIQLYVKNNFFDLDINNMVGKTCKMLYGKFDGGIELTPYEQGQRIILCKSVYETLKDEFDIRYDKIFRWVGLCQKLVIDKQTYN